MDKYGRLSAIEKQRIEAGLAEGITHIYLAKVLERYNRTLVSFVEKPNATNQREKGCGVLSYSKF